MRSVRARAAGRLGWEETKRYVPGNVQVPARMELDSMEPWMPSTHSGDSAKGGPLAPYSTDNTVYLRPDVAHDTSRRMGCLCLGWRSNDQLLPVHGGAIQGRQAGRVLGTKVAMIDRIFTRCWTSGLSGLARGGPIVRDC